jgi:hypothetical protein
MKIQAILFMCNDFARAKFTLENFFKWNPDIPIRVINSGGDSPKSYLEHIPNIEFIDAPNLWHKKTLCGVGSFGPGYYEYLFEYGLNSDYSHTLFLETDVLTNRKISIAPKYDISGPNNFCSENEYVLYDYLQIRGSRLHTGCGATIFTNKYFDIIKSNTEYYDLYQELFDKFSSGYYMDLISTLVGRKAGLTFGHWEEVSNIPFHVVDNKFVNTGMSATLVHNFKI